MLISQSPTTFTCPICLTENQVISNHGINGSRDSALLKAVDKSGSPAFELSSCNHIFCAACLRAYVRHKLMDGQVDVPCCHFELSSLEDGFRPCNVLIPESDIYQLIHSVGNDCDEVDEDGWGCDKHEQCANSSSSKGSNRDQLWIKYKKLDFDRHHGKDAVRRCPKCDEAHLFDEESMKQYQTQHFTQNVDTVAPGGSYTNGINNSTENMNLMERVLNGFRQTWRDPVDSTVGDARRDAKADDIIQAPKEDEEEKKDKLRSEHDIKKASEGINPTSPKDCFGQHTSLNEPPTATPLVDSKGENDKIPATYDNKNGDSNMDSSEHIVGDFGQIKRDPVDGTTIAAVSDEEIEKIIPAPQEVRDANEKDKPHLIFQERSGRTPEDANSTLTSLDDSKDKASNPRDGGSSKFFEMNHKGAEHTKPPSLAKSTTPNVTCSNCSTEFCYFHSNAHSAGQKACVAYHKKSLELDRANVDYAKNTLHVKPCPTCGISVSKEGGCNQMKCGSCNTHFCWLCGEIIDDGAFPAHFRWWNLKGCANMQLDESLEPKRCTIVGARLLSIFQILVLGIPSLVLTLMCMILCPCFIPGCGNTNRERVVNCFSFWGSFLSSMLVLPFTCVGMLLLSALCCFVALINIFLKAGQGRRSTNESGNHAVGFSRDDNAAAEPENNGTPDLIIREQRLRELEGIFERMEGGS